MTEWKEYIGDRFIKQHQLGFFVIKPKNMQRCQPLFCPICESIMNGIYDESTWENFDCCDECAGLWVYPNKEKWEKGWRPSQEQVKLHLEKRLFNAQECQGC